MTEIYLDVPAVARLIGVRPSTIHQYRLRGTIPPADLVIGRSPAWRKSTIAEWMASRLRPGQHRRTEDWVK